jgi:D-alanyl-D-alanine carboxypeptidase (penicillin-binding protein 5/6)
MKRFTLLFSATLCFLSLAIFNTSYADISTTIPDFSAYNVPTAPLLDAKAYLLFDPHSGTILAEKNANTLREPASLTKLMTLYLVFQDLQSGQLTLNTMVPISTTAWRAEGSRMFVKVGSKVSVQDLILGITVQSGNDATIALAEYVGGSLPAFVQMMNQTAGKLGMTSTHFDDPTGLHAKDHISTARDLALLTQAIIQDYPEYYHFFGEKWFTWNKIRQPNRNRLLWQDATVDGLKTGHTDEAGFCLISSGQQSDSRFVAVILGAKNDQLRTEYSQSLLNYAFRLFISQKITAAKTALLNPSVRAGKVSEVAVGTANAVYITIPRNAKKDLSATYSIDNTLKAPITQGQTVGTLTVSLKGQIVSTTPLVALNEVPAASWFTRFFSALWHFFAHFFTANTLTGSVTIS